MPGCPPARRTSAPATAKGIGEGGNLRPDRLTQLLTRPLGVKGGHNPLPAAGGADREQLADARRTAPLTALTLGRIVSLADYEDFARAFAGIGKALATWTWNGNTRGVFVTVAGPRGAPVETGSTTLANLLKAILAAGDPIGAVLGRYVYAPRSSGLRPRCRSIRTIAEEGGGRRDVGAAQSVFGSTRGSSVSR